LRSLTRYQGNPRRERSESESDRSCRSSKDEKSSSDESDRSTRQTKDEHSSDDEKKSDHSHNEETKHKSD
jgi:hypothetical protein